MAVQGERNASGIEAMTRQSRQSGLSEPQLLTYVGGQFDSAATVRQLQASGRQGVFLLGSGADALSFMREAEKAGWFPSVFLLGAVVAGEVMNTPVGFDRRVFMAFPIAPADQSAEGMKEFRAFSTRHQLPTKHVTSQIQAYAAAKLLVEGLKRAGKDLSRERLVQALEGLYEFKTGLTRPITFGPNRHTGALGAYVITVDLKEKRLVQVGGWIGLEGN